MKGAELTVVYVDVLIFTNCITNFLILYVTAKALHIPYGNARMILSAFLLAFSSMLVFLPFYRTTVSFVIRLMLSGLMVLIAYPYRGIGELLRDTLSVFCCSLLLVGLFIAICQLLRPPHIRIINDFVYFEINPLLLIGVTAALYILLILYRKLFSQRIKNTVVTLCMTIGGTVYDTIGMIDTGCTAVEPFSGAPIIVVSSKLLDTSSMKGIRVIPFDTVGSSSLLYAVKAGKLTVNDRLIEKDVYIGSSDRLNIQGITAILNPDILR